ncbi:MAG: DUF2334 domain-containing protein, partial [Caldilineae bacterium]
MQTQPQASSVPRRNGNVPVLITWDVDPDPHIRYALRQQSIDVTLDLCHSFNLPATFFVTARAQHLTASTLQWMVAEGHEIGCHGLTHSLEEDFNRMPLERQRQHIQQATEELRGRIGQPLLSFRSPRVKTSAHTLQLLYECGYRVDSSVCSQRFDFISSNLLNPGWLIAPRLPYQPSSTNPFRRGDLPIWEVPVSAMGLPFISSTLRVLGTAFMKRFFKVLYLEARRTGKPIVYLAHPTEFVGERPHRRFRWRHLSPAVIRKRGLLLR